jgi:mono/diheme cytochrome c family protein
MKKWLKIFGIAALSLVGVGASAVGTGSVLCERKLQRTVDVAGRDVAISQDEKVLAHGRYLFESRGCTECHGASGAGRVFIDDGGMFARAPNITRGKNSAVLKYKAADWDRAVRHGVSIDSHPLLIMPSEDYCRWSDEDFSALISYVVTLPPVDGEPRQFVLPPMVRTLYAFGAIEDAAEKIDHKLQPPKAMTPTASKEYGAYVANMCVGCHGAGLSGGKIPGGPPNWPAAANLTPGEQSAMVRYQSVDQFRAMFRSGKRPDGSAINTVMPFAMLKVMNDTDVEALYLHLKTLAPRANGQR